ncbi:MAG: hypothetical protein QM725_10310 [Lacibacter sp.]
MNKQLKYLIVEDSLKVCEGILERMENFREWKACSFAHHVEEAKKIVERDLPQLIFIDWALKGGSAYDVLDCIQIIPGYSPYIIFNTGYQSENPEIPQEIFNNYKIDKYIVKPIWENLRKNLVRYVREAELKLALVRHEKKVLITDIQKKKVYLNIDDLVCVCKHHDNSYLKSLYINNGSLIQIKSSWEKVYEMISENGLNYFITNHKEHLIMKEHIESYHRPFVKMKNFNNKIEVVKDKLAEFEKWIKH